MSRLQLVVPCYRDAERLAEFLPELGAVFAGDPRVAIVVVDDGSGEGAAAGTKRVVEAQGDRFPEIRPPLLLPANRGKGGAIYAAWDAAPPETEWLGFVDADGAVSAAEVARLVGMIFTDNAADAVLASRVKMLGRRVDRTLRRHLTGRVFATLTSLSTGLPVYDSQCGLKIVRADVFRRIRPRLVETRFAFDVELLVRLAQAGATLREVPVDWRDIPGSKVSLVRDSIQMAAAVLRLRRDG